MYLQSKLYQPALRGFDGKVYEGRWGSIAFCVQDILKVRRILTWGWSQETYLKACTDDRGGSRGDHIEVDKVDEAIHSDYWWCALEVLDLIFNVVRDVFAWVESCPCHHRFLHHKHLSLRLRQLFLSCPLRGCRMPELSAGGFLRLIENKLEFAIGDVLLLLSPSLTEEQRANLVNDFQLARAHLLFAFSLKTAALQ